MLVFLNVGVLSADNDAEVSIQRSSVNPKLLEYLS